MSNTVAVPLGSDGKFKVFNLAGSVGVNIDVQGYFSPSTSTEAAGGYVPMDPVRVVDTVAGVGTAAAPLNAGSTRDVVMKGLDLPPGVTAVFANVKVFGSASSGRIKLGPLGDTAVAAPTVDFAGGTYSDSGAVIRISADGGLRMRNLATSGSASVIVDVHGFFSGAAEQGGVFTPLTQQNAYDTGLTNVLAAGETRIVTLGGSGGLPATGASSAMLTVSASHWTNPGFVIVQDADRESAQVSSLSFNNATLPENGATSTSVVGLSETGQVSIKNHSQGNVRVRLSAQGWFGASSVDPYGHVTDTEGSTTDETDMTPPASLFDGWENDTEPAPSATTGAPEAQWMTESDLSATSSTARMSSNVDDDIPYTTWPACGYGDSRWKKVIDMRRNGYHPRAVGNTSRLNCGMEQNDGAQTRFGFRHLRNRHADDYARRSAYIGRNWRDLADWMIRYTLSDADRRTVSSSTRFCYERKFYLVRGDHVVKTSYNIVLLGKTGKRVMTAFPPRGKYCTGSAF